MKDASAQLTGIWQDDNITQYNVRQVGDEMYLWLSGEPVQNVFCGYISGNTITGKWVDLPGRQKMSSGSMAMEIVTNDLMHKIDQSGNYGTTTWRRKSEIVKPGDDTPIIPPGGENRPEPSGWDHNYHFDGPKEPMSKPPPPPAPEMPDRALYDQVNENEPKFKLEIINIEQIYRDPVEECYWPGNISIEVTNTGNKSSDTYYPYLLKGEITALEFNQEKGKYEYVNCPIVIAEGTRDWGRIVESLAPNESGKVTAYCNGGHKLADILAMALSGST